MRPTIQSCFLDSNSVAAMENSSCSLFVHLCLRSILFAAKQLALQAIYELLTELCCDFTAYSMRFLLIFFNVSRSSNQKNAWSNRDSRPAIFS